MTKAAEFRPDGVSFSAERLRPLIEKRIADIATSVSVMKSYFHTYRNVRYISRDLELCEAFERLAADRCGSSDVFDGIVSVYKALGRSTRELHLLRDLCPDHVVVHDRADGVPDDATRFFAIVRPRDRPMRKEPFISSSPPSPATTTDHSGTAQPQTDAVTLSCDPAK